MPRKSCTTSSYKILMVLGRTDTNEVTIFNIKFGTSIHMAENVCSSSKIYFADKILLNKKYIIWTLSSTYINVIFILRNRFSASFSPSPDEFIAVVAGCIQIYPIPESIITFELSIV